MASTKPLLKAGPFGRAQLSPTLQRRPQGDPRERTNAAILATNKRTARGITRLDLGLSLQTPPTDTERWTRIEAWARAMQDALILRSLMEQNP